MPKRANVPARRYAEEFLAGSDQTKAYRRALGGEPRKTDRSSASKCFARKDVQAALAELRAEQAKRCEITADYVLGTIRDTVERCRQAEPVKDRKGNPVLVQTATGEVVPAYTFDAQGVLRGAELLGRNLKLFTEKHEIVDPNAKEQVVVYLPDNGRGSKAE